MTPNKITTANSRPARGFYDPGEFGRHSVRRCFRSAPVAEFCRSV